MAITVVLVALFVMVWVTALVIGVMMFINSVKEKRTIDTQNYIELILIPALYERMERSFDKMMDTTMDKSIEMTKKITKELTKEMTKEE